MKLATRINSSTQTYHNIYWRMWNNNNFDKLKYFLQWNKRKIKGRDIDEVKIFDSTDLYYIKSNNGKSIH